MSKPRNTRTEVVKVVCKTCGFYYDAALAEWRAGEIRKCLRCPGRLLRIWPAQ